LGAVLGALLAFAPSPCSAAIRDLAWGPEEDVQAGVTLLPPSAGTSVVYSNGLWHVVYAMNGGLVHQARADTGWLPPEALVPSDVSEGPAIADGGGFLHVVWQSGSDSEVHTRRWDGAQWSSPECLSCDDRASWGPVIAGEGSRAFAAWEEYGSGTLTKVRGRFFENGAWAPVEDVSTGPASAHEPSVSAFPSRDGFVAAWVDDREGDQQVYVRTWNPWVFPPGWQGPEQRVTSLTGNCRHPSIHGEGCCGDVIMGTWLATFELEDPNLLTEAYRVEQYVAPVALAASDFVPSVAPQMGGYAYAYRDVFGGPIPVGIATWTELTPEALTHRIALLGCPWNCPQPAVDTLSTAGLATSVVGVTGDGQDALLMALWIEDRDGVPMLVARRGHLPGGGTSGVPPGPPVTIDLGVVPNPCRDAAVFQVRLPGPGAASIRVLDASGRLVRDLGRREAGASTTLVFWDTRDGSGRSVPPGRYFAVARAPGWESRKPFVVIR
jgi:hypothetical protein